MLEVWGPGGIGAHEEGELPEAVAGCEFGGVVEDWGDEIVDSLVLGHEGEAAGLWEGGVFEDHSEDLVG